MSFEGGCYCGAVRYETTGDPIFQGFCHCRECQYISGGGANVLMAVPEATFKYTKGTPKAFQRGDLDAPVTREFCADCGTHLLSKAPGVPGAAILKVGTLDDSSSFQPQMAIYNCDKKPYHLIPEGVASFDRTPNG